MVNPSCSPEATQSLNHAGLSLSATEWTCLHERLARSDARFDAFLARFDEHARRTNEGFQRVDTRLDRLDARVGNLGQAMSAVASDVTVMQHDVREVDRRLRGAETDLRDLLGCRQRLWGMATAIATLGGTLGFVGAQALQHLARVP
jgi:hypothetical protein